MTQRQEILAYLESGDVLTPLIALEKFGCMALSQRCGELIRQGHPIERVWTKLKNGKTVKSYFLNPKRFL